jgi:DNA-directed RNA polymerase specialized sigma24 family protein
LHVIRDGFDDFVNEAEPRLRRAFIGAVGMDRMPDAVAEALGYSWEHWGRVSEMANPVGYIFRVGQSKTRSRKPPVLSQPPRAVVPHIEPGLTDALMALPIKQRTAVWLAHGCGWSHDEIGTALEISTSTVATHVRRGLTRLRTELGVHHVES